MIAAADTRDVSVKVEDILGYGVTTQPLPVCVDMFLSWLDAPRRPKWLACLNPHSCIVAERDAEFSVALKSADLLLPDGAGIVLASRLRNGHLRRRVSGPDFFLASMAALNKRGHGRVFFLGSTQDTLLAMAERMSLDFPRVTCCGFHSPPYLDDFHGRDAQNMIEAVNAAEPDVLWVGLTAPKQEKWILRSHMSLHVSAIAAVGAAFDFYSGRVSRANPALRVLGLEWLSRLAREPKRMWRRNFVSSPIFLWRIFHAPPDPDR
jgi:N-acetylglucosaminyldiphosphoundecaprenol N-acetyl-beta-D-mannosaminyltransferase